MEKGELVDGELVLIREIFFLWCVWVWVAASGTGFLVFIDDVIPGKSSRMNPEVFSVKVSAHIQPNASKLVGWHFLMQRNNDLKHTLNATQHFFKA